MKQKTKTTECSNKIWFEKKKLHENDVNYDIELDPEIIEMRHRLFDKYVKPHFNMIYKLCIQYSNAGSSSEENYSELLVNFYRHIHSYDPKRSLLTWLHIVTKRHTYKLNKKNVELFGNGLTRKAHDGVVTTNLSDIPCDSWGVESSVSIESHEPTPELTIDNYKKLCSEPLVAALGELTDVQRRALIMQTNGYSTKEIALIEYEKGNISSSNMNTLKSKLFFAKNTLKRKIKRDGGVAEYLEV